MLRQTLEDFWDQLPDSWRFDRMKDVISLRSSKVKVNDECEDYLELEDIESSTGRLLSKRSTIEVESAVTLFKRGDVLFGKLRPYLEKYYLADFDGKCTGEILAFKPDRISGEFLRYCIASSWFIEKCNALAYGAKMPRVNWPKQLAGFDIPLPSPSEQRRIATYLDNACEAIDGAIEAKQKQLESLADLRKSIIHKAVTRGLDDSVELKDSGVDWLGKIPRHWRKAKLRYEVSIGNGAFVSDSFDAEGEIPVFGGNGTMGKTNKFNLDGSAVIVGRVGAHCGNAHFVSGKVWVSDNALILETAHNECFLKFLLQAYNLNTLARKTAQPLITGTQIKGLYVGMPSHDEQTEIAQHIVKQENSISAIMSNIKHQIQTLSDYRKSLIHECVTGQRRIMEADIKKAKTSKTKAKSK